MARSGYYKWLKQERPQEVGQRAQEDQALGEIIEAEFWKHRGAYGSPRMCDRLRQPGQRRGRRRVSRLMVGRGLIAQKGRRLVTTTKADPTKQPAPNVLNREFYADGPNRKWVPDITVIPTAEGDLYLASTMDLWSRMIISWATGETMEKDLVHQAFDMAVQRRWPNPGLLHHSDQGSQYTANGFRGRLQASQCIESNSRKGNVWDNAVKESCFSSLEVELPRKKPFSIKAEAIQEVFIYIEIFYNRQRIHSSLGGRSPAEFEAAGGN